MFDFRTNERDALECISEKMIAPITETTGDRENELEGQ
jgi:hypothetical protein